MAAPGNAEPRINDRIRAREVRLVSPDGDQLGIRPLPEALRMARDEGLDLVEVAEKANPPVCKIMDYGKYKYEAAQRAKESRKKSSHVQVKEMKYRPKIGRGDFDTKTRKVVQFLGDNNRVKITIMFRGREMQHPELGRKILDQIAEIADDVSRIEAYPKLDGRNMVMVLVPDREKLAIKKKARDAAEAQEAQAAAAALEPAAETAPAETAPAETAPAETAPAETAPAETAPVTAEPANAEQASGEAETESVDAASAPEESPATDASEVGEPPAIDTPTIDPAAIDPAAI